MEFTPSKTVGFAVVVSLLCSILVSFSAVGLRERQKTNEKLDRQQKVLDVAGLLTAEIAQDPSKIEELYKSAITSEFVSLKAGFDCKNVDAANFDQLKFSKDPATSEKAPAGNKAKVQRIPNCAQVFRVTKEDPKTKAKTAIALILPVEGKGLWSTLYGYIALEPNLVDVKGLTFYKHAETPGLGGEVDNPKWKAQWKGKRAFNEEFAPALYVQKGVARDNYSVDGLSGATLTSNGVTHLLQFWLGEGGFGPYLKQLRGAS